MTLNVDTLFSQWELYLLILVRITSFIYTAPFFSMSNVPARTKLGLAVFVSYIIVCVAPEQSYSYDGVIGYAILVLKEAVVGLSIGFCANLCVQAIHFAGYIIDINIGLSMATMYDPATKMQVNLSGQLYYYVVLLLMMASGLHRFLIQAIVDTYAVIPVGAAIIKPTIYNTVLEFVTDYFVIGFRIALPVFITLTLMSCILGIMSKIAPQMNMFAIGMQLKILVGLFVMYLTVSLLPSVSSFLMETMKSNIVDIVKGMYTG